MDYSLRRWPALTLFLGDAQVPIDNNWVENQIRPVALGRKNWLFAGSLRAGQRAAAVMSLIQSAKLNGHDPYAYLKDVMDKLPSWPNSRIDELLPHRWKPAAETAVVPARRLIKSAPERPAPSLAMNAQRIPILPPASIRVRRTLPQLVRHRGP